MEGRRCLNYPYPGCKELILPDEQKRGPRPRFCSNRCKVAWWRKHPKQIINQSVPNDPRRKEETCCTGTSDEQTPQRAPYQMNEHPPVYEHMMVLPTARFINGHSILLPIINEVHHCQICGGSWFYPPERETTFSCPKVPLYSLENRPAHLLTKQELQERGLLPSSPPDAVLSGIQKPWTCLYDIKNARPTTEKRSIDHSLRILKQHSL